MLAYAVVRKKYVWPYQKSVLQLIESRSSVTEA
jgi:hypothetical protein